MIDSQKTVFISYRRSASKHLAQLIFQHLRAHGYDVFLDVYTIDSGEFDRIILRQIAARTHFIVLLSPGALDRCVNEGDWLRREIEEAMRLNRNIVPILEEGCDYAREIQFLPDEWRDQFTRHNMLPYSHFYFDSAMEKLRTRFLKLPEYTIDVQPTPEADREEVQRRISEAVREVEETPVQPEPSKDEANIDHLIQQFYAAYHGQHWYEARRIAEKLAERDDVTSVFDQESYFHEIDTNIKEAERLRGREREYNVLRVMAMHEPPQSMRTALRMFWRAYPYHDPDNLRAAFFRRARDLLPPPIDWIDIPGGNVELETGTLNTIEDFAIAKYPVTNAQYEVFVEAGDGYENSKWWQYSKDVKAWRKNDPLPKATGFTGEDHPRTNVNWFESVAYCQWLSARTGYEIVLPTEQQWQRAAVGDTGRIYPWGDDWDGGSRCRHNIDGYRSRNTLPVTRYEGLGDSPFGVVDMAGNVKEWCTTSYYTGDQDIGKAADYRVLRGGGSWHDSSRKTFQSTRRRGAKPSARINKIGFRIARLP